MEPRPQGAEEAHRLEMTGIAKSYGAVRAIRSGELRVRPGTVHALVGENGAGKSTLIKILAGAEQPDSGEIRIDGRPVGVGSTAAAIDLGVATVYQEPQLFPDLTVAENVFLGRELRRRGQVDWVAQNARVVELLELIGLPARYATAPVRDLSIAEQQQVSIAKALGGEARILILDEPSAILTDSEIEVLFGVVRRLVATGVSVVYISHRLDELFTIASEVTVMRDGETVGSYAIEDLTVRRLVELMVGGTPVEATGRRDVPDVPPLLRLEGVSSGDRLTELDLAVRPGEVVTLYGLVGCGAADAAEVVYGIRRASAGRVLLDGAPVAPRSPRHARALGIGLLPSDRKRQGSFSFQSISFNIAAGNLPLLSRAGVWVDRRRERQVAREAIARFSVKTPHERQPISSMSGGNAQKVVLARQLVERPRVLVLAEPTQGVDVGAKEEIHRIVRGIADEGSAVLVVTTDLGEAIRLSDRLVVLRAGRAVAEFAPGASQADVLAAAAGDTADRAVPA
ncbi:sugar ABC transporter ATP-binding protein [uncultured Pseudokineococcus sp.]|uniref:sugar ABC transporter ATP-binding protein n=1 Tax=uncultured Pseudokineococcus sp. TaxID=1642928 RepID=UPI00261AC86C|nr:sugar ABC transporter ATP-binding protein [uncultured Pseudokineococcus sp.]